MGLFEGGKEVELVFEGIGCTEEFDSLVGGRVDNVGGSGVDIVFPPLDLFDYLLAIFKGKMWWRGIITVLVD